MIRFSYGKFTPKAYLESFLIRDQSKKLIINESKIMVCPLKIVIGIPSLKKGIYGVNPDYITTHV